MRHRKIAMIARWKPVHVGHAAVLDALLVQSEQVIIGIGSSNRYNARNPFTPDETEQMLDLALALAPALAHGARERVTIVRVPDLDDGPRWREMVVDMLGPLDAYVTANDYVRSLLLVDYEVVHPVHLVPRDRRARVSGTMVRLAMARGEEEAWRALVPPVIADHLTSSGLYERFRREFGDETIRLAAAAEH